MSDFEELADWALYEKWQLIRRSRFSEINAQSYAGALQWADFRYYMLAKGAKENEVIDYPDIRNALPYNLEKDEQLTEKTAKIICEAAKNGSMPPRIQGYLVNAAPHLWERIWALGDSK